MSLQTLTLKGIRARPVMLKLSRPVVARIATLNEWPLILIDLYTEEGVVGRSYLEPYIRRSMRYLIPALHDLGELLKGHRVSPVDLYQAGRKSPHFVGYEGMSMIAVAGLDMAAWDPLAKAAGVPLCVLLGGSVGAVPAYNSNGLWLKPPEEVASEAVELRDEGGFKGLKLRLGRERLADDLATIEAVRKAVGSDMDLMVDFNQGLHLGEALERCHAIDDFGLAWGKSEIAAYLACGSCRLLPPAKLYSTGVHVLVAAGINIVLCCFVARPVQGVGILLPGLVPTAVAAVLALLFAPHDATPPVARVAGVAGPLIGADLPHLREIEQSAVGLASIGGAGTFDGIVLSGVVAACLA